MNFAKTTSDDRDASVKALTTKANIKVADKILAARMTTIHDTLSAQIYATKNQLLLCFIIVIIGTTLIYISTVVVLVFYLFKHCIIK